MAESKEFKTNSFLSESIDLNGNLYVKGGIRIDGKVRGLLRSESTIFVGEEADIEADIVTQSLVSNGSIKGRVVAKDTVKINKPGSISGEIYTCNLGIEKEVYFNGRCQILSPQNNPQPKLHGPKKPRKAIPTDLA